MIKPISLAVIFSLLSNAGFAQTGATSPTVEHDIFTRIANGVKDFKPDTTVAPTDRITKKIIELRSLKGGFNINEAIDFKIEEDKQKNEVPKEELEKLSVFFKSGNGKRWLDNAAIWIYRHHFTYSELKQLVRFYKTSAGQKTASNFPIIMLQSLKAAEMIKDIYTQQQKK